MQINSISGVSFKGDFPTREYTGVDSPYDYGEELNDIFEAGCDDTEDYDNGSKYTDEDDECTTLVARKKDFVARHADIGTDHDAVKAATRKFALAVKEAKDNVHPFTVLVSTAIAGVSAVTAKKNAMPFVRKTAVTVGEYVSKGATKLWAGLASVFHKDIDTTNAINNINKFANKLRSNGDPDGKMIETVRDFVSKSTDEKTANKVVSKMKKANIKTPAQVFDVAVAAAIALFTGDVVSDRVEQRADKWDIAKAKLERDKAIDKARNQYIDASFREVGSEAL